MEAEQDQVNQQQNPETEINIDNQEAAVGNNIDNKNIDNGNGASDDENNQEENDDNNNENNLNPLNNTLERMTSDDEYNQRLFQLLKDDQVDQLSTMNGYTDLTEISMHKSSTQPEVMQGHPSTICVAAFHGSVESFRYLLLNNADLFKSDDEGRLSAHFAAASGCIEILALLNEFGVDFNEAFDRDQNTPMHYAASYNQTDCIKWLWTKGLSFETPNIYGWLPFHKACAHNALDALQFIIENCNPPEEVNSPEEKLAKLIELKVNKELTPVMLASRYGATDTLEFLLSKGARIDLCDELGSNALMLACENRQLKTAEVLINHGIDIHYTIQQTKWSALQIAIRAKSFDLAHLLLRNGAQANSIDMYQMMPIHWASKFGLVDIIRILIDYSSEIDPRSKDGWTPLILACGYGSLDCVQLLLDKGAKLDVVDIHGTTPFMFACMNGNLDIAEFLYSKNQNINAQDNSGWNALHWACSFDRFPVVKYLLRINIDYKAKNNNHQTPYDIARQYSYSDILQYMEEKGLATHSACFIA